MFVFLEECVVSKGPINPQPRAWLQALGHTAYTDEFVSVITAHSSSYGSIRQTHTMHTGHTNTLWFSGGASPFLSATAH